MRSAHGDRHSVRAAALANQSERQQNGANRKVDTHMKRKWKGLWTVFLLAMLLMVCVSAGAETVAKIGEVEYVDGSPVAYEMTISAQPGTDGCTHHEYLVSPQETNSVTQASE